MKANKNQPKVISTFMGGVKSARKGGNALNQEKSAEIAVATISTLFRDDGTPITLSSQQTDILTALIYPKNSTRMRVIKATLKSAGCTLDETTEELLNRLLTPALLEKKLEKVQTAPPAINWSDMIDADEQESAAAETTEDDPLVDDDDTPEAENAPDSPPVEPPPIANATKPTSGKK